MPKIQKANKRDQLRHKKQYGHKGGGRSYLHILNRKNKEREQLKGGKKPS